MPDQQGGYCPEHAMRKIEEILAALQAIIDAADGRSLTDDEIASCKALEAELADIGTIHRDAIIAAAVAVALRGTADLIDSGPTFPMRPSIISALVRERADDIEAAGRA